MTARMAWRLQGWSPPQPAHRQQGHARRAGAAGAGRGAAGGLRHRLGRCGADGQRAARCVALAQRLHLAHPQRRLDQTAGRLELLRQRLLHASALAGRIADLPRLGEAGRRLGLPPTRPWAPGPTAWTSWPPGSGHGPSRAAGAGFVLVRDLDGHALTRSAQAPAEAQVELQWLDGRRPAALDRPPA